MGNGAETGEVLRQAGVAQVSLPDAAVAASADLKAYTRVTRNTRGYAGLVHAFAVEFYG